MTWYSATAIILVIFDVGKRKDDDSVGDDMGFGMCGTDKRGADTAAQPKE